MDQNSQQNNAQRIEGVISHSAVVQNLNLTVIGDKAGRALLEKHWAKLSPRLLQALEQALLDHAPQGKPPPPDEVRKLAREVQAKTESSVADAMAGLLQDSNDAVGRIFKEGFLEEKRWEFHLEPHGTYPLVIDLRAGDHIEFAVASRRLAVDLNLGRGRTFLRGYTLGGEAGGQAAEPQRLAIAATGRHVFDFRGRDAPVDVTFRYRVLLF
ncbi:MAG: hypothetical protein HY680_06455 [Chloroflexi bacterium]|nr:hypothetical protein [Chloroflexota bacterium]